MARWLSWLERRPVTAEVVGSSPIRVVEDVMIEIILLLLSCKVYLKLYGISL